VRVTANISGLDAMKLGALQRQALVDALRARVVSTAPPSSARAEASPAGRAEIMPNVPDRPDPR
jgi:hypothetical protein